MAVPIALMAAGTALSIIGQLSSNAAQAEAEAQNAKFYEQQAAYARLSQLRAEQISEVDYGTKIGQQIGAYASGGVDISGSAALTVGGTLKQAIDDVWAIKQKGDMETKLARMRGAQSAERASMLSSAGYNIMQAATTGVTAYSKSEGLGQGFPSFLSGGTPPSAKGAPPKFFPGEGA